MRREDLDELHYITPLSNVPSICRLGILSHRRVRKVEHESVAMQKVQNLRAKVRIPQGRQLHEYANLYICARNPMLFKIHGQHRTLCVLRIDPDVLESPDVVIAAGNAASKYTRFAAAPDGLRIVNKTLTFAEFWTDEDPIQRWRQASAKCAEVLVPDRVDPQFITGAYVSCQESRQQLREQGEQIPVEVNPHLFFC